MSEQKKGTKADDQTEQAAPPETAPQTPAPPPQPLSAAQEFINQRRSQQGKSPNAAGGRGKVVINDRSISRWCNSTPPTEEQALNMNQIRERASELAQVIKNSTRSNPTQAAALQKVREAMMLANSLVMHGE